jgi:tetratricopeptide (TPR) repeat protein
VSIRILISGHFNTEDVKHIDSTDKLNFSFYPKLNQIIEKGREYVTKFLIDANQSDLVIFALFGSCLEPLFSNYSSLPEMESLFQNNNIKKVLWSLDPHHNGGMELKYQRFFSRYYICSPHYLYKFKEVDTCWLPCSFFYLGIDSLIDTLKNQLQSKRHLVFPFNIYNMGDRDLTALKISRILAKYDIDYFFGFVGYGKPYIDALQESKICLNINMADGLNLRNFEAWAFNKVLLTNSDPEYDQFRMDLSDTFFYKRDLSDFEEALQKALHHDSITNTSQIVLNNHMVIHRYIEIINKELDTSYKLPHIEIKYKDKLVSQKVAHQSDKFMHNQIKASEMLSPNAKIYFSSNIAKIVKQINELIWQDKIIEAKAAITESLNKSHYRSAPDLLNLQAEVEILTGNRNRAKDILSDIIQRYPFYSDAKENLQNVLSKGTFDETVGSQYTSKMEYGQNFAPQKLWEESDTIEDNIPLQDQVAIAKLQMKGFFDDLPDEIIDAFHEKFFEDAFLNFLEENQILKEEIVKVTNSSKLIEDIDNELKTKFIITVLTFVKAYKENKSI